MNEFYDNEFESEKDEGEVLADRFKYLVANNEPVFFASDDFIEIIDYFEIEGDYDNLVLSTDIALKLYPDNEEIVLRKCNFILEGPSDDYSETVEEVMYYAEPLGDLSAYIYRSIALNLFEEEEFDNSVYFSRLALIKNVNDEEVLECFVIAASRLPKREKECMEFLEALAKANTYSAYLWFSLALLSLLYGKNEDALDYIEYSLALDKTNAEANRCKAEALMNTGKLDEGIELLGKILEQDPQNAQVFYSLGGGFEQKENWEKAIYYYKKAFANDELNFSALMNIGLCYFSLNDFNTAKQYADRAIKAEPDNIYFKLSYANMLYEAGYKEDGEQLYREIYDEFKEKDLCAINWAMSLADDGRLKDAIHILDSTINSCEFEEPTIYYTLIDLAALDESFKEIVSHYLSLLALKFKVSKDDLIKSCPNLMKNNVYKTMITQYINEEN
ncbi:MAG: tetratricopeptide repeat protein [Bacteroidales bacterium]|jgi:tetratricopeptide (TPR) repeat protein|nr:tetratricopeptide repeat protein [Bacteroidales bacterium]